MERIRHYGSIGGLARLVAAALLAMATMTASTANVMAADGSGWRVSDISGNAQVKTGGDWRMLKRGDMVEPGSQVKTGAAGRVILVRPGDSLDVAPESEFRVPNGDAAKNRPATHISQSKGTILFRITTRPENPFTVETPYLAAVIKGTTFTVSVDRDDAALHVSKGAVQVASVLTGQTVLVGSGQTVAVNARNGGAMRLIGFQKSDAGNGASGAANAASAEIGESKAGRGTVTTVIPRAVGVTDVDIGKVSKGLVNRPGASVNRLGRGGAAGGGNAGDGNKASAGKGIAISPAFDNSVPATHRAGQGIGTATGIGNSVGNGIGNANGVGNGNGIGNGNGNANGNGNGNGNGGGGKGKN